MVEEENQAREPEISLQLKRAWEESGLNVDKLELLTAAQLRALENATRQPGGLTEEAVKTITKDPEASVERDKTPEEKAQDDPYTKAQEEQQKAREEEEKRKQEEKDKEMEAKTAKAFNGVVLALGGAALLKKIGYTLAEKGVQSKGGVSPSLLSNLTAPATPGQEKQTERQLT